MHGIKRRSGITSTAVLTVAAFVPALGLAHAIAPHWVRSAGLDVWNLADETSRYRRSLEHRKRLQNHEYRFSQRVEAANRIAAVLIDGRITLDDAVREVELVNRDRLGFDEVLALNYPTAGSRHERFARYLMTKVQALLEDEPERCRRILDRLEGECRSLGEKPASN